MDILLNAIFLTNFLGLINKHISLKNRVLIKNSLFFV